MVQSSLFIHILLSIFPPGSHVAAWRTVARVQKFISRARHTKQVNSKTFVLYCSVYTRENAPAVFFIGRKRDGEKAVKLVVIPTWLIWNVQWTEGFFFWASLVIVLVLRQRFDVQRRIAINRIKLMAPTEAVTAKCQFFFSNAKKPTSTTNIYLNSF